MRRVGVLVTLVAALGYSVAAFAVSSDPACVKSARDNRKVCQLACQEQFQVEKDACRNVDHSCAEDCRTIRKACFDVPLSAFRSCIQAANDALETAIADCKANPSNPPGSTELDTCIDAAQVTAFQARDLCREGINRPALKACRQAHRACLNLCPPTAP